MVTSSSKRLIGALSVSITLTIVVAVLFVDVVLNTEKEEISQKDNHTKVLVSVALILSVATFFTYKAVRVNTRSEGQEKIDKLKDEFGSMVTHELKTPFVPIRGHIDMLKEPDLLGKLNPDQLESLNVIIKHVARLEEIITDLLDVQKLEMNSMTYRKEDFQFGDLIRQVTAKYSELAREKEIELVDSAKENYPIKSDREKVKRVLSNLVKNSIAFVPEKTGRVEVGAKSERENVIFYVKDNGTGIPKDKQQNIFKKFYQVDTSATRKHGGVGLGLVVCKGIVEGLGGKIWFESEQGKGTNFYFSIPKG